MQTVYNYELVARMSVPSLISRTVSVDVKHHVYLLKDVSNCSFFSRPIQRCLTLSQWPGKLYPQNNDIIIIIDRFYVALFSAVEQTHCARM